MIDRGAGRLTTYQPSLNGPAWDPAEIKAQPSKLARLELSVWAFLVIFLAVGYYTLGKSFAYFGVPQLKLFVGEIFLVLFVLAWPGAFFGTWATSLIKRHPLTTFAWAHLIFLAYGLLETLRGISKDYSPFDAILNLVFNVYPVYVFIGYWFATRVPGILERVTWWVAFLGGVYGVAYIGYLNTLSTLEIPHSNGVVVFGQPIGSIVALMSLIIIARRSAFNSSLILLNALVLIGIQVRSNWLGFIVALVVWGAITRNLSKIFQGAAVLIAILGIALVADLKLPGLSGRGGETSARSIIGRALAGIDKEAAREFDKNADDYAGTVEWRKTWWKEIWASVHENETNTFLGHGYGFPLASLVNYIRGEVVATRTPHNIFYYALGYGGWIGTFLFVAVQLSVASIMWSAYRKVGFSFGIPFYAGNLTVAFWGNFLEAPFGAIPFYIIVGMCAAKMVETPDDYGASDEDDDFADESPQLRPSAPSRVTGSVGENSVPKHPLICHVRMEY